MDHFSEMAKTSGLHPEPEGNDRNAVQLPCVFEFEDYHVFLKAWTEHKRVQRSSFSFQELANRAGMKSRSYLRKVSVGEMDLLHAAAVRLAGAMDLEEREADYFAALVGFNNAKDPGERDLYLKKMRKNGRPASRSLVSAQEFDFFSKWYVVVVWEVVTYFPFGGDFKLLGEKLDPVITPDEARHALKVLLDLGMISPKGDRYLQTHKVLHTRDELVSRAIRSYQKEAMELGIRALERVPAPQRHISTLTMGLDAARWEAAKKLTQEYRQKLIDLGTEAGATETVYQFNFQIFPATTNGPTSR